MNVLVPVLHAGFVRSFFFPVARNGWNPPAVTYRAPPPPQRYAPQSTTVPTPKPSQQLSVWDGFTRCFSASLMFLCQTD
jgi:hypothetical protein